MMGFMLSRKTLDDRELPPSPQRRPEAVRASATTKERTKTTVVFLGCVVALWSLGGCGDSTASPDGGSDASMMDAAAPDAPSDTTSPSRPPSRLETVLRDRFLGDRTGACVQGAFFDGQTGITDRALVCAGEQRPYDAQTAFEIGSISKTMTGFLIQRLVREGEMNLEDPLSDYVSVDVPMWEDTPVRLRHLVTHTSGFPSLPASFMPTNFGDPYASLSAQMLIDALPTTMLSWEPGTGWAYSNMAYLLLSHLVATEDGGTFEEALQRHLWTPLGVERSFVETMPADVTMAPSHIPGGTVTPHWTFAPTMAGVGGVRATVDDMMVFARLVLGEGDAESVAIMEATLAQQASAVGGGPRMATGWLFADVGSQEIIWHNGGTGGASSVLAVDRNARQAVVLLSDTSLGNAGGITDVGLHLLSPAVPLADPRREIDAPAALLDALAGEYDLFGLTIVLSNRGGSLHADVSGQPSLTLGYDDAGDFFPRGLNAVLRPVMLPDGTQTFDWYQGGPPTRATRVR